MLQALKMGLSLSMNPFVLSSTLGLLTLLSVRGHSRRELITYGPIFILGHWLTYLSVLIGNYDHLLYHPAVHQLIYGFYVVLAAFWSWVGWMHLDDWRHLKKGEAGSLQLALPRHVIAEPAKDIKRRISLLFSFFMLAWLLGVAEARLTQNYYLLLLIKAHLDSSGIVRSFATFASYMTGYTVVMIALWAGYVASNSIGRLRTKLDAVVTIEKIGYVAFYWAVAFGLMYYLIRIVQF